MKPIESHDTTIGSAQISNFAATWAKEWIPLSKLNNTTQSASSNPEGDPNSGRPSGARTGSGAKAGIGVGAAVGGLAIAAAVILFFLRKRCDPAPQPEIVQSQVQRQITPVHEASGEHLYREAGEGMPHEAETDGGVHELAMKGDSGLTELD